MRVIDLENINYAMRNETQFVLRCEEVFHDKISAAAAAMDTVSNVRRTVLRDNMAFIICQSSVYIYVY